MQNFKQKYYKEIEVNGRKYYLYKMLEKWDNEKAETAWITAYSKKGRNHTNNFVVESGAGIPKKRMLKQIMMYLKRHNVVKV